MSPIMVILRWSVIIVMYILHVFWIGGDISLNMSHNTGVEDMLEVERLLRKSKLVQVTQARS
jgi:hypothetical protein